MTLLWHLAVLPSLLALIGLLVPGRHREPLARLSALAPLAAVPLAAVGSRAGGVDLPWLLLGTRLELDQVGRPLLLVAALLYAAALAGTGQAVGERRPAFAALLLVCFLGNAGLLVAADAATFYLSFAVMGFCAYGLVVHDRTATARRAGRVYLVLTVLGELCLITGLLLTVSTGGPLLADLPAAVAVSPYRDLAVGLLITGFGVKAGLVPLHLWLPLAHPAAPAPASAVLSGAMVKAGLVGMVRFLPLGEVELQRTGEVVGGLGLAAAFLAVAVGLTQSEPKAALAYSTISQMGLHLLLVGVALARPELAAAAVAGAVLYAAHHGLAKGAVFLGVGVHKAYGGSGARPLVLAGLSLSALSLAGAPLTSGAAAKYGLKEAVGGTAVGDVGLVGLLSLSAVATTLLLLRVLWLLPAPSSYEVRLGAPGLLAGWAALVVAAGPLVWLVVADGLPEAETPATALTGSLDATWPVLVAGLLGAAAVPVLRRRATWSVPPGDVVVPAEAATRAVGRVAGALTPASRGRWRPRRPSPAAAAEALEGRLVGWQASGAAVLVLLAVLALAVGRP